MTQVGLPAELLDQLEMAARAQNRSVTELLNEIVRDYIARRHDEWISAEAARFREMHAELWANDGGRYVAMRAGQVLDHDSDLSALHGRVRARLGNAPVLIAPVSAEPAHAFRIRRPRLERTES